MSNASERIQSLDLLRGLALLGILLMNIVAFSMPFPAYMNGALFTGGIANQITFALTHVLVDQKFMALFSLLFGASFLLIYESLEAKGSRAGFTISSRFFWLLMFGLIHTVFIWQGDILSVYAICGFGLIFFRHMKAKTLFIMAAIILLIPIGADIATQTKLPGLSEPGNASMQYFWQPSALEIEDEIFYYRYSSAFQIFWYTDPDYINSDGDILLIWWGIALLFGNSLGMMLAGMALFKAGILNGKKSNSFYFRLAIAGLVVGITLTGFGYWMHNINSWHLEYSAFLGHIPQQLAMPFMAFGYVGLFILWSKSTALVWLQRRIAAVGQMALTNYIAHSLICTMIFYGSGLGLYGSLDRWMLYLIVLAIWALQLLYSPWWMASYRYGPLEWVWRSLTYWKLQRMEKD